MCSRFGFFIPIANSNGCIRFVVCNYKYLNQLLEPEVYPLPKVEEQFVTLAGSL